MRTFFNTYGQLPKMRQILCVFLLLSASFSLAEPLTLKQKCVASLQNYKSYFKEESIDQVCEQAQQKETCASGNGEPIFHVDYKSKMAEAKKILVISLIHGDETPAGGLGRFWLERLHKLDARNSWRVIPVANPDGVKNVTRTNANGIDLNRNFPTADWDAEANKYWIKGAHKSPRKFPGSQAGSEVETQCIMRHLEEYTPDFVVSIHTPLKVLDFDGPKLKKKVSYNYLPWRSLGNFPGSLGRYLWVERKTPVLTAELKDALPPRQTPLEELQDLIGTLVKADLK